MTNLLHLVVSLVEDADARARFRADPQATVADIHDLTAEDVAAVADVARHLVDPSLAEGLIASMHIRSDGKDSPRAAAIRSLHSVCDRTADPT